MPRCDCSGSTCQCLVTAGEGVAVTGSGNPNNPYVITSTATLAGSLQVRDTPTVDMSAVGAGTPADPFVLSAVATVGVRNLTDVDPNDVPAIGDTMSFNGSVWVFGPPPVAPAGAVNATGGIIGTGAVATPLRVAVSGTWGTAPLTGGDSTIGQQIYVDANGQLRAAPIVATNLVINWDQIVGAPSAFPTTWDAVAQKPTTFPTTWTLVDARPRILSGRSAVPALAPGQDAYIELTFPAGSFTALPFIVATNGNSAAPPSAVTMSLTTGRIGLRNLGSTSLPGSTVQWIAIQPPPTI